MFFATLSDMSKSKEVKKETRGRKPIGSVRMTNAERQKRYRDNLKIRERQIKLFNNS